MTTRCLSKIRRARRVSSRVSRFVAWDVGRRHPKEPQAHYALGASLGDWAAGVSGDRETARPRLMHALLRYLMYPKYFFLLADVE
jgi:hypothetical protein